LKSVHGRAWFLYKQHALHIVWWRLVAGDAAPAFDIASPGSLYAPHLWWQLFFFNAFHHKLFSNKLPNCPCPALKELQQSWTYPP
jgi:hypothetical protein